MKRILLAEDNEAIVRGLSYLLTHEGYAVTAALTAAAALSTLSARDRFDLAILDISLPDGSGFSLCRACRETWGLPVIFLTARDEENDVVRGLELGAEDYVIKPFRNRELLSRIKNVLRRYEPGDPFVQIRGLTVDTGTKRLYRDDREIVLTALEERLFFLLFENRGITMTRERLLERIWDDAGNFVNDNTLTVYIRRLRKKLGEDVIETMKGKGYRIEKET